MIDLDVLARTRLRGGHLVHAVTPPGSGKTACGKYVRVLDTWGRRYDSALDPKTPTTCRHCINAERTTS